MDKNHSFWTEFIELYREETCLWDVKSNDYSNKHKRNASYDILLKKLTEINKTATVDVLKKKINNMRTAFRRELKKVQASKRTGTGGDTYETTLWYYDLLLFTAQSETGRTGRSTDEVEDNLENDTIDTFFETNNNVDTEAYDESPLTPFSSMSDSEVPGNLHTREQTTAATSQASAATPQTSAATPQASAATPKTSASSSSNKSRFQQRNVRQKTNNNTTAHKRQALLDLAHTALSRNSNETEDEYQITGKRLGYQLRGIEEHQRIIAEKLISDVMFYAKMGKLTEDSSIQIYSRSHHINTFPRNYTQAHDYSPYPRPQGTTNEHSLLLLDNPQTQTSASTSTTGEFFRTYQPL